MKQLSVVKYLSKFVDISVGIDTLEMEYGVKAKIYDNFFLLNYSQIESPKNHPITNECRGLILDWELNILRRPFDRFYNYGEADTQNFDFSKSVCMEKADGSLIPVWWNPFEHKWCFGTRGTAFAESECNSGRKFEDIINECFLSKKKEDIFYDLAYKGFTFIFELCSPENRVVVPHTDTYLVLLGVRYNSIGNYTDLNMMGKFVYELKEHGVNVRLPFLYDMNKIEYVIDTFKDSGAFFEGYVFWNNETNERVKVKNPAYVAIHHLRDNGNLNPKRICELVFTNETDEYLSYFPEDKKFFDPWVEAYNVMIETINFNFKTISKQILTQKEYALLVKDLPYSGIMFALRQGKTIQDCFEKMNSDAKVRLLENFKG